MTRLCLLVGALAQAVAGYLIYTYAPIEATLGLSQKIFYFHLPLAWWGLFSFFLVFIASILTLTTQKEWPPFLLQAAAEIGELLAILTLLTGMIWGRIAWGVWWTWDPRLTTALILCFIYGGLLLMQKLDLSTTRSQRLSAAIGIIGFIDVPLVFLSARYWRSIHPAVFTSSGIAMTHEMIVTLFFTLISFGLFWFGLLRLRMQSLKLAQQINIATEQALTIN
ncbi:MAG: cytochrome c biogenesis protein CcsA [Desulfovibrionaceae bacterium]|nr:cytochrome c biogenesis protein CcsA [Desulfovibrionaceae bacterium]